MEADPAPHTTLAISGPTFAFIEAVRAATATAVDAATLRHDGELGEPWRFDDGLLLHGSRIFIPAHDDLRHQALLLAHSASHEGVPKTLHHLRADFFIPNDRSLVQDFVRTCTTCQRNKT